MAGASAASHVNILTAIAKEHEELQCRLNLLEQSRGTKVEAKHASALLAQAFADVDEALGAPEIKPAERRLLLTGVIEKIVPDKDEEGEWGIRVTLHSPSPNPDPEELDQIVSMISTLARGTVTVRPSESFASSTRTMVSESTLTNSEGNAVTEPSRPK